MGTNNNMLDNLWKVATIAVIVIITLIIGLKLDYQAANNITFSLVENTKESFMGMLIVFDVAFVLLLVVGVTLLKKTD